MPALVDWTEPFSPPLRPRRPGMPMADPTPGGSDFAGGFSPDPDAAWQPSWYRDALPETAFNPQLTSSGSAGMGVSGQPQADTTIAPPRARAGELLAQNRPKDPPPPFLGGALAANLPASPMSAPPEPSPEPPAGPPPIPVKGAPPVLSGLPAPMAVASAPSPTAAPVRETPSPVAALTGEAAKQLQEVQRTGEALKKGPGTHWGQRLALAALSMTRLAPIANQLVHPKYSRQVAEHDRALDELKTLTGAAENLGRAELTSAQAGLDKGRYLRVGDGIWDNATAKWIERPRDKSNLVPFSVEKAAAAGIDTSSAEGGKVWLPANVASQLVKPGKEPGGSYVDEATGKKLGILPDEDGSYYIPPQGVGPLVTNALKPPAPPSAEARAQEIEGLLGKMYQEGVFKLQDASDLAKVNAALSASKVLTAPEKASVAAHFGLKTSPASTGTAANIRVSGFQEGKLETFVDTQTNQLATMNAEEFNRMNKVAPGRYVMARTAVPAMKGQATFSDIQYNIDNAREALQGLGAVDAATRAQLANALADESGGRIHDFLTGSVMATMNPQQRKAIIALKNLYENAFALRGIAGMGQGSDQLRAAILATLPNAKSPDVPYMLEQIRQFEGITQRLREGTPGVGRPGVKPGEAPPPPPAGARVDEARRILFGPGR